MICIECGAPCTAEMDFCPGCGAPLEVKRPSSEQEQAGFTGAFGQTDQQVDVFGQPLSPFYGQNYLRMDTYWQIYQQQAIDGRSTPIRNLQVASMRWHNYLTKYVLWVSAIRRVLYSIAVYYGGQYEDSSSQVYGLFPGLRAMNVLYGTLGIALGIFAFYVAYSLLKFKRGAPKLLITLFAVSCALDLIYLIGVIASLSGNGYIDLSTTITSQITLIIISAIMIVANNMYYDKRDYLFVN